MIITWFGQSCFRLQDKTGAEGITLVTDPYDSSIGLKPPQFEANIVTVSHDHSDHNNTSALKGDPFIVDTAGEYDVSGVMLQGVESYHDESKGQERGKNIIYRIDMDNISVSHLGDLGHTLNNKQLEVLAGTDILLLPIGGTYTIDAKKATEVVSQVQPRMVIPMHYSIDRLKADIEGVETFIKELALKPTYEDKLKIQKKDLPQEDMELVILNCQS